MLFECTVRNRFHASSGIAECARGETDMNGVNEEITFDENRKKDVGDSPRDGVNGRCGKNDWMMES